MSDTILGKESTFVDRLYDEKRELDDKLQKLRKFQESDKFKGIDPIQMSLLNIQEQSMSVYSQCLMERISWLKFNGE